MQKITEESFYDIIDKIQKCLKFYEGRYIYSDSTLVKTTSNMSFNFKVPRSSVAHLLGVSASELAKIPKLWWISKDSITGTSTYELLNCLIKNKKSVFGEMDSLHPQINFFRLFSEDIERKLSGFVSNLYISASTVDWICKYNKKIAAFYNGEDKVYDFDYIIRQTNREGNVLLLGLRQSNNGTPYLYPVSNQFYSNPEDSDFAEKEALMLNGQTIVKWTDNNFC